MVDQRDSGSILRRLDHLDRLRPIFPGLATHRKPATLVLARQQLKRLHQILKSLVRPDGPKEEDVAHSLGRLSQARGLSDRVMRGGPMSHDPDRALPDG